MKGLVLAFLMFFIVGCGPSSNASVQKQKIKPDSWQELFDGDGWESINSNKFKNKEI